MFCFGLRMLCFMPGSTDPSKISISNFSSKRSFTSPVKCYSPISFYIFCFPAFCFLENIGISFGGFWHRHSPSVLFSDTLPINIDYPIYYPQALADPFFYFPKIVKMFVAIYPVTFVAVAIKLLKYWYANQQAQQVLTQQKLQAELKFLKTQIHPHFLFNTLNNLYALTLKKSERAPEMVLKLSELINYMLYECASDDVPLTKEVKFIRNYGDIEKMRYGDKLDIDIRVTGDVNDRKIAPLVLLPFVENCFKHGASRRTSAILG